MRELFISHSWKPLQNGNCGHRYALRFSMNVKRYGWTTWIDDHMKIIFSQPNKRTRSNRLEIRLDESFRWKFDLSKYIKARNYFFAL